MSGVLELRCRRFAAALMGGLMALSPSVWAVDVVAEVRDRKGDPLADVVVLAVPLTTTPVVRAGTATIDQVDKEFVAYVNVVQAGTRVRFPNHDNMRHHVYSFSPAKVFDLPLYAGNTAPPVTFDQPGVVVMGCNIHDWMVSYLYVADTPWFALSGKDGLAHLTGLPRGDYRMRVWHPRQQGTEAATRRDVELGATLAPDLRWVLDLGPDRRPQRAPMPGMDGYR